MKNIFLAGSILLIATSLAGCNKVEQSSRQGFTLVTQTKGPDLGYSPESGVSILTVGGKAFKDHNRNGVLDVYEDWRKTPEQRAEDLTAKLTIEDIAGLMLCSHMQVLPANGIYHYDGKVFAKSNAQPYDLTDEQKVFLIEDKCQSVLLAGARDNDCIVKWVNKVQAYVEGRDFGIPVNILSDPRHHAKSDMEFLAGSGGQISQWPNYLGFAATFDPELQEEFGRIASAEYRALGITTALSPQADVPGEPRWWRFDGTFGESTDLITDMVRAYCDGFQTSEGKDCISGSWGRQSVNTMVKHWYGYGAQEGGREAHFPSGEYGVFPTGNLEAFRLTFANGAFKLAKGTGSASAVMTNYSVLFNQDPSGENVACSYSDFVVNHQLREVSGFDGVVCTDWDVMFDYDGMVTMPGGYKRNGKSYGVEDLTLAERHYRILKAGVDQFGGSNDAAPVLEAYRLMAATEGEEAADARFRQSARRILLNMFRVGVFENPYSDMEKVEAEVGSPDNMAKGYEAQLKSVVMLKNSALPVAKGAKVYFPKRHFPRQVNPWGGATEEKVDYPMDTAVVARYYTLVDTPEEADFALLMIEEPALMYGYDITGAAAASGKDNGYLPVSLQWEDYTADEAREVSISGGNPYETFTNRTFKGKTVKTLNRDDMVLVQETKAAMPGKPVIVCVGTTKPFVPADIEPWSDALLVAFGIQRQALLDVVCGDFEPSGLLPMQLPANMSTVEKQMEDVPGDMECYVDAAGNTYDFAFGMNWNGKINDSRTEKYSLKSK